jgi:probable blue pigment (indigoidine) exporter
MSRSPSVPRALVALTLAAASWGAATSISKRAVEEIPPLTLLPIQLAGSLVLLAVLMRLRGQPLRGGSGSPLLGRLGLLNPGLAYALSLLGLVHITASLSVLLWAVEPLMILFLAVWLLRERAGPWLVVLSLVAAAGMVLVIHDPAGTGQWLGVALTLAGVACCAVYTVVARRWLGTADSTAQVVLVQQAYALTLALVMLAGVWLTGGDVWPERVSTVGLASALASGLLYYGIAYWLYLSALREVPASVAAVSFYLIPVFGVAAGILFLGERLGVSQWVGVAVVLAAVLVIARRSTREGLPASAELQVPPAGRTRAG